ncbi:MAG: porin [Acetobacteraceae bacterium]|jgi:porin|nr:porin [Acetobacteraceae bacterium]
MTRKPKSRATQLCLMAALGIGAYTATTQVGVAQVNNGVGIGPSEALAPPTAPPPAPSDHLFGDWGGLRTTLGNLGINVTADWTAEVAGNVSGGVKQGATYAGQVGLGIDIDWEKLAGIKGFSTHTVLVNREGANDSNLFGDHLIPVQEIYGAGGDVLVHLVYAYAEQSLLNGRVDIAVGRMPVLNDFDASPLNCNFMNNGLCGNPKELPGADIGMSSYPDAVWGGRIRVRPTPDTYIQTGLYEVNQGLYTNQFDRTGFEFNTSQDSGVEVPVEVAYEPLIGPERMPGHYKLGFAYDSSTNLQFFDSAAALQTGTRAIGNKTNYWMAADQMIVRNGPGPTDGIILLAGYVHSDPALSAYTDQVYIAALDRGFWPARPLDTVGILFNYQHVSNQLATEQTLDAEFGLPIANGATGVQTTEETLEVNYDIHVFRGVSFEPDFQYVIRPNAQSNIKNAAVFGFKSHINF